MTRLIGRRFAQRLVAAGTDQIIAAFPLPRGGKLNSLFLDVQMAGQDSEVLHSGQMSSYGVTAYVVPVPDPDSGLSYEAAWDAMIPKDAGTGSGINLDTATADTNPEDEPGEVDIENLFNMVGLQPRQIFKRLKYLSYATSKGAIGGTALDNWMPADAFTTTIRKPTHVSMYSYVLVAMSSPFMTTTAGIWDVPTEAEWAILQYLDMFVEKMFIASISFLDETGADLVHLAAEVFITELLEDTIFEQTAAAFHPMTWNVFCRSTFDISVPGRPQLKTLTAS